ncbi:MAG: dimethylargininase [Gammaproteobacteria bacterium]|jgi:dimethylargininase|nr:dimethylargininase [Gammaproteobacteria bacterium]
MRTVAVTRELTAAIGNCELTFLHRSAIDFGLAQQQHRDYQSALSSLGCEVVVVPAPPGLADSVFIEDTALVLDDIAVMLRPGVASRQPEVAGVAEVLQQYKPLKAIEPPGTIDGGDLLRVGNRIFAGLSTRSNQSGIQQLRDIVSDFGMTVETVETTKCLHLKSAVSEVAPGTLLINTDWISSSAFKDFELIPVDKEETHAANALRIGKNLIYPSSFPRTMDVLVNRGIDVVPVDLTELQKAEGAVTCCSLIFSAP